MNYAIAFWILVHATVNIVLEGYVLSILWGWFIVTEFGLQPISMPLAIAMAMMLSLVTNSTEQLFHISSDGGTIKETILTRVKIQFMSTARWLMGLGVGWILLQLM